MSVRHNFISILPAGSDPNKINSSHWNDDHEVSIDLAGSEVYGVLPIEYGGLGANNSTDARANLELGSLAVLNQINIGGEDISGVLGMGNGGTGATDQPSAINALLPDQGSYPGYFLYTDGSNVSWQNVGSSGVNIYVNGNYQGYYSDIYFNDSTSSSSGNTLYGADGNSGGSSGVNIYVNGSYQGNYSEIYFTDYTGNSYSNYLYGADGYGGGGGIEEAPYDGNKYARQYNSWVTFSEGGGGSPSGNYGDIQFNYYGSFYGESYLNYDFSNHTLILNGDGGYAYNPRQITRASYYQYADLQQWQDYWGNPLSAISRNGGFKPAQMNDSDADNNSIYYSINYGKLVFKDPNGSTYELY